MRFSDLVHTLKYRHIFITIVTHDLRHDDIGTLDIFFGHSIGLAHFSTPVKRHHNIGLTVKIEIILCLLIKIYRK